MLSVDSHMVFYIFYVLPVIKQFPFYRSLILDWCYCFHSLLLSNSYKGSHSVSGSKLMFIGRSWKSIENFSFVSGLLSKQTKKSQTEETSQQRTVCAQYSLWIWTMWRTNQAMCVSFCSLMVKRKMHFPRHNHYLGFKGDSALPRTQWWQPSHWEWN